MFITLKQTPPAVTDPDHISLLLPTRGRPQMLAQVFASLEQTIARKKQVAVWLYIDEDDRLTRDAIAAGQFEGFSFGIHWVIGERAAGLGEIHNLTWRACTSGSGIFMLHADDTLFVTPGWDDIIRAAFNKYPDRILAAHPHDPDLHEPTFQMILSAEWLAATGRFSTAYFPFWFDDIWLDQIGQIIGRRAQLPIKLGLIGGKGKTPRMRNVAFWTGFFNHTLDERVHAAKALQEKIQPASGAERDQIEHRSRAVIHQFHQENLNFSDLYGVFREERHSNLSYEQRQAFDERYFSLEARAVARLLAKAQAMIKAGRFEEALMVLEVISYSDLRSKYVNLLKAQCLRATERLSEAEKLEQDNAQMWPDTPLLRRVFRFVAYVFVEAKRMVYSKW
jgi:hypothetical protein